MKSKNKFINYVTDSSMSKDYPLRKTCLMCDDICLKLYCYNCAAMKICVDYYSFNDYSKDNNVYAFFINILYNNTLEEFERISFNEKELW